MGWVIFAAILLLNSLIAVAIAAGILIRRSTKPGSKLLVWLLSLLALWTFAYAMITVYPTITGKIFWLKIENIGIVLTPSIWLLFALSYTRHNTLFNNKKLLFGILLIPGISLALIFSPAGFQHYYTNVTPIDGIFSPLKVTGVGWYKIQLIASYSLLLAGLLLLLRFLIGFRETHQRRMLLLLAAFVIPVMLNLFYHLGNNIFENMLPIDLAPVSLTITASMLSIAIFNQQLLEVNPIARHIVLDNIIEMVLVTDEADRILDANPAATYWLDAPLDKLLGISLAQALADYPKIVEYCNEIPPDTKSFHLFSEPRHLEMNISPIRDRNGEVQGRVLVFHDIGDQRRMENELQQANNELKAHIVKIEKLQAQLREQAIRDPLTGLYNRRYLSEALERDIANAEHENHPIAAVIMDVDHFKSFNDRHGHKCGDAVLEYLAKMLLANTRRGDTVCRYGGEEFVIIMPRVDIDIALQRAETWRRKFESTQIEFDGEYVQAKLSAGVACYPIGIHNGEDLIKAADIALYHAKENGRNQVAAYPLEQVNERVEVRNG